MPHIKHNITTTDRQQQPSCCSAMSCWENLHLGIHMNFFSFLVFKFLRQQSDGTLLSKLQTCSVVPTHDALVVVTMLQLYLNLLQVSFKNDFNVSTYMMSNQDFTFYVHSETGSASVCPRTLMFTAVV